VASTTGLTTGEKYDDNRVWPTDVTLAEPKAVCDEFKATAAARKTAGRKAQTPIATTQG
jgi:hypothetical protein